MERYRILLTNDDGYSAPGIDALHRVLRTAHEVTLVAPKSEQSGVSHAFTFNRGLQMQQIAAEPWPVYAVAGTPSDCVKFGIVNILGRTVDCVISGINLGENSGTSGYYSGTVAAAREGAFWGLPSIAFSLCAGGNDHLGAWAAYSLKLAENLARASGEAALRGVFFNVNYPACAPDEAKGVLITRQSMAYFDDNYREVQTEAAGLEYWLYGKKKNVEVEDHYDSRAVENGYITITPLHFDATALSAIHHLRYLEQGI
jgi:5'-nucleotidase